MWSKIKTTAISVKDETARVVNEAKSTPNRILCVGCNTLLLVPDTLFDWKCEDGHDNKHSAEKCITPTCTRVIPKHRTEPAIRCASCHAITPVPFTNAEKQLRETGRSIKQQYVFMKSKPSTFNCSNCDNLLMVPEGPWACQTCTSVNAQELEKCIACQQKKSDQRVMCGVCKRSTTIPSMNIVNSINKGLRDASKETFRIYYDLSKHPYITCPRCNTNVPVDLNKTKTDKQEMPQDQKDQKDQNEGDLSTVSCYSCGITLNYLSHPNIAQAEPLPNQPMPSPTTITNTVPSKTPVTTSDTSSDSTVSGTKTT